MKRMEEIEFEYVHFDKQYKTTCKDCDVYLRPLSQTILWEKRESQRE